MINVYIFRKCRNSSVKQNIGGGIVLGALYKELESLDSSP